MTRAKKGTSKTAPRKGIPAGGDHNLHKRLESERISDDIASFEKSGGRIEKLGVTRVLQKVAPAGPNEQDAAPPRAPGAARKK
jgi:hypothetical protein